jgi:hypothetical protein
MMHLGNTVSTLTPITANVKPTNYIYVGKNGSDSTGDGSANLPYLTIGAAITAATSGKTIFVWPGTYTESITFKAGVNLTSPAVYSVYVIGNHVANFTGTVINENIVFQNASSAASGTTLAFSGTGVQNLQFYNCYINSASTSGAGDAVNWTNTSSSSKIQLIDGNISVAHSNSTARAIYTDSSAAGSFILNRATVQVDNSANTAVALNGAVTYTHTFDVITGQVVMANTSAATIGMCTLTTSGVAALTTNSSGASITLDCIINTDTTPAVAGAGIAYFSAIIYAGAGAGGASTLNGGYGALPLVMAPIRVRAGTLLPAGSVSAGYLTGTIEFDGTNFYLTRGTARDSIATSKVPVTAVSASGAITVTAGRSINAVTATSAAALTVAAPSSVDGTVIQVLSTTAYAHTVTFTGTNLYDGTSAAKLTATFAAYAGANIQFVSYGTKWYLISSQGVTLS